MLQWVSKCVSILHSTRGHAPIPAIAFAPAQALPAHFECRTWVLAAAEFAVIGAGAVAVAEAEAVAVAEAVAGAVEQESAACFGSHRL